MKILAIIFYMLFGAGFAWMFFENYFYSPKFRIKKLWNEIFKISEEIGKLKKFEDSAGYHGLGIEELEKISNIRGNLINTLLDYHFPNSEEDEEIEEYKKQNRYEVKK